MCANRLNPAQCLSKIFYRVKPDFLEANISLKKLDHKFSYLTLQIIS